MENDLAPKIEKVETPTLETERLLLRPLRQDDAGRIQELFPHLEILKYMSASIPWPYPADGSKQFIERKLAKMEAGEDFVWAITRKDDGDGVIGVIELFPNRPDDNRGFWIGLDYQGKGYMTEAVAAVNDFAFDVLGVPHLILNNAEPNIASHRLKEKSGAVVIDVIADQACVGGEFRSVRWRLTRDQWKAHRDAFLRREP